MGYTVIAFCGGAGVMGVGLLDAVADAVGDSNGAVGVGAVGVALGSVDVAAVTTGL
jgi:hypothetical protein